MNSLARSNFWRRCHLLVFLRVLLETNLGIFTEGNLLLSTSNLPLGVTNEESCHSVSSEFLAPLPRTLVYKIGELHTIFYRCFLVLLVYLSVFIFVSFIENHKKIIYLASSCHYVWSFSFGEVKMLTFKKRMW